MKRPLFEGVATALITPFTLDEKDVDYKAFEKLINFQIENSVDAVVVSGTTGESPVLSGDEKQNLFSIAKSLCGNDLPVIAGTGSNNTIDAVRKSNDAEKKGVDGLLIVTPFYNKCTQTGLIEHYNFIADRVSTPIIVYNVPSRTGVNILPETYLELSKHKNICAIKEASDNISAITNTVALCGDSVDIYTGNDDMIIASMASGAKGVISVASNIIPSVIREISHLCTENNFRAAEEIYIKYHSLIKALFLEINPIPVKFACNLLFGTENELRLPLTKLSDDNKKKLTELLRKHSLIK